MSAFTPFTDAFGLDIGDLSIKLVQLAPAYRLVRQPGIKIERYYKVREVRTAKLQPGYIVNGEIQQPELVRKKILHLLGKEGPAKPIKTPWAVADLPEPKTFLKMITVDFPAEELTYDDVCYHIKKHLPFNLEDTYIDWQIIGDREAELEKSHILIGGAPKSIADSYTYLLESAGLTPLGLEIEGVALCRSLITAGQDYAGEGRIILDIGATRSSLVIYDSGTIQFSASLDYSGELLTAAISQTLKMEPVAAEELKIKNGLNYDSHYNKYLPTVSQLTEDFIGEIKKVLNFYKAHFPASHPITRIIMCGGGALLKNLDKTLSRKLRITARTDDAWKNLRNPEMGEPQLSKGLILTSAIGLALRAMEDNF